MPPETGGADSGRDGPDVPLVINTIAPVIATGACWAKPKAAAAKYSESCFNMAKGKRRL